MTNTRKSAKPNALANRIAGLNDPSMGDERERDVILRAYTFGSVISIYVFFALGVLFAVIGGGLFWTALIFLGSGAVGVAASIYCKREGVDFKMVGARVNPKRLVISQFIGAAFAIAWVVAIAYHESTGHPLIDVGLGTSFGSSSGGSSIVIGAASGFITVIVVLIISRQRKLKQARLEAARAADIEDED